MPAHTLPKPKPSPIKRTLSRPLLRFVVVLTILLGAFYALTSFDWFREGVLARSMILYARSGATILSLVGEDARAVDNTIVSSRSILTIHRGCDAAEPTALFIAAVLAFPVSIRAKALGVAGGTVALALLNLLRIISLYLISVHVPRAFDVIHVDVWQAVYVFLALALWLAWANRAMTPSRKAAP